MFCVDFIILKHVLPVVVSSNHLWSNIWIKVPMTLEKISLEYVRSHDSLHLQFVYTYNHTFTYKCFFQPHVIDKGDIINSQMPLCNLKWSLRVSCYANSCTHYPHGTFNLFTGSEWSTNICCFKWFSNENLFSQTSHLKG